LSDVSLWECPNCGSTDFAEIAPHRHQCAYCGTVLTSHETASHLVRCPRCGFDNEQATRYCANCGRSLVGWTLLEGKKKTDPAVISIIATFAGSLVMPIGGAILGLILGYRALREARATDGRSGSESLARVAVILGWAGIAVSVLPLCMVLTMSGVQGGYSACAELFHMLSDMLIGGRGG
jgi:predicted RNA-binding Zn-ribbon protein involved in translation (DUF1610 family)/uncharacterized membrane protein